jgi:hypothetical protein
MLLFFFLLSLCFSGYCSTNFGRQKYDSRQGRLYFGRLLEAFAALDHGLPWNGCENHLSKQGNLKGLFCSQKVPSYEQL